MLGTPGDWFAALGFLLSLANLICFILEARAPRRRTRDRRKLLQIGKLIRWERRTIERDR